LILMMIFRPAGLLGTYEFSLSGAISHLRNRISKSKQEKEAQV
jgi:hypothetical protein